MAMLFLFPMFLIDVALATWNLTRAMDGSTVAIYGTSMCAASALFLLVMIAKVD